MFDVYYCKDEKEAKKYFNTKVMEKAVPQLYLIDPLVKKKLNSKIQELESFDS